MPSLHLIYREFIGFANALARQERAFAETEPGFRLETRYLDVPPLYDEMVARRGCFGEKYDLFLAVTDWLPELMQTGAVERLDDYLAANPPPGWPDGWAESVRLLQRDRGGHVYGMAYHDGPEVFMYRTDLFEDPREQARFAREYGRPLAVPRTWSEFRDVARFFTRPDEDLYGCVVAAKPDGHNDVYDFMIHLASRGGQLFDERWRPTFADETGREALQFYLDLIHQDRATQPNPWEYESVASGTFYASGRAAMMWNWCGFQVVADLPSMSKIPGKTRATMLPGGDGPGGRPISLNVYWCMTIPTGSRRKDEAWRFLKHLGTPAMDLITTQEGGNGVRLSTWRDPAVRRHFQFYDVIEEVHQKVISPPRIPEYPAINEILNSMMAAAVTGAKDTATALREASEEIETMLAQKGYY
jgi:multiple sugar transport system substrate-binding protein